MILLIDIGNSRVKWACLRDGKLDSPEVVSHKNLNRNKLLEQVLQVKERPDHVYIANVAGKDIGEAIAAAVMNKWEVSPGFARVEAECAGVINAYHDITQLGVDRWLAVVAAWKRYQSPAFIVSCGTAVTIDGIAGDGRHLGGLIVPGLDMMQNVLVRETNGINAEAGGEFKLEFGRSTAECINYGSVRAIVSLIDHVAAEMYGQYGKALSRVITGGYAGQVNGLLAGKFEHDPHLVLHGLAIAAEKMT